MQRSFSIGLAVVLVGVVFVNVRAGVTFPLSGPATLYTSGGPLSGFTCITGDQTLQTYIGGLDDLCGSGFQMPGNSFGTGLFSFDYTSDLTYLNGFGGWGDCTSWPSFPSSSCDFSWPSWPTCPPCPWPPKPCVPAPMAIALGAIGIVAVVYLRRRRVI